VLHAAVQDLALAQIFELLLTLTPIDDDELIALPILELELELLLLTPIDDDELIILTILELLLLELLSQLTLFK
jgi:hypothetical protein